MKHSPYMTYRIERGPDRGGGRDYALFVTLHHGPGMFDWGSLHFSRAKSRGTLLRRVGRLYPQAVKEGRR